MNCYSAQETCHHLLQLPLYNASRDFVILNLDGTRVVKDNIEDGNENATLASYIDHYMNRPTTDEFNEMSLYTFVQNYKIPKRLGDDLISRKKPVVVVTHPYCPPDPNGPKFEQYCYQKLITHQPFRNTTELLLNYTTYKEAYLTDDKITNHLLEDWMTICQIKPTTNEDICITHSDKHIDWTTTSSIYPNMEELITFIVRQKQTFNT